MMFAWKTNCCGAIIFVLLSITADAFDIENDLVFRLYTPEESTSYYALKPMLEPPAAFDPNRPTRIFIHGYKSSEKVIIRYKDGFLNVGDYNFIGVDWIDGANTVNYLKAKGRVPRVSEKLADLIDTLVAYGLNLQDLTIVGHSLGAHIAGLAAKQLKSGEKIQCIVRLDPASVAYEHSKSHKRLAISDANYVEIIHTGGDKYGFVHPLGHADFYPNGGKIQPGCSGDLLGKCSHIRAHDLFLESLTDYFPAVQCDSFNELQHGKCTFHNVIATMGGDITADTPKEYGIFFSETKSISPFNISDYRNFSNKTIVYPPNNNKKKFSFCKFREC